MTQQFSEVAYLLVFPTAAVVELGYVELDGVAHPVLDERLQVPQQLRVHLSNINEFIQFKDSQFQICSNCPTLTSCSRVRLRRTMRSNLAVRLGGTLTKRWCTY